jgi:hypothetical protein
MHLGEGREERDPRMKGDAAAGTAMDGRCERAGATSSAVHSESLSLSLSLSL